MGLVPRMGKWSPNQSPRLGPLAHGPSQRLLGEGVPEPTHAPSPHVSQGSIDVVVGVPIGGDEEGQAAVRWQDIHAAVLVSVPWQQGNTALLHIQGWRD